MKRTGIVVFFIFLFFLHHFADTGQKAPVEKQMLLMLKLVTYDRNFERYGDPVKIGVTTGEAAEILKKHRHIRLKGKKFVFRKIDKIDQVKNYHLVYMGKNWRSRYRKAADTAKKSKTLLVCQEVEALTNGGSVSFTLSASGQIQMWVNLPNAIQQGVDFSSDFLTLCWIVKQGEK